MQSRSRLMQKLQPLQDEISTFAAGVRTALMRSIFRAAGPARSLGLAGLDDRRESEDARPSDIVDPATGARAWRPLHVVQEAPDR
jgi:hypothetical protein